MAAVLYSAPVLCPMAGPPLEEGGVLVVGDRIARVGEAVALRREADREHRVEGVLLPGLVNAHTALEHTDASALAQPGPEHLWQRAIEGLTARWPAQRWPESAQRGVHQLLRAGTTCVGDVVHRGSAVPAACRAGLAGDSWAGIADVDVKEQDAVLAALRRTLGLPAPGRRVGIAPLGAHRLGTGVLQALVALARAEDRPLHIPAAASDAEVVALWHGDGPYAAQAIERGLEFEWLEDGAQRSPVRYLEECGALGPGTSLGHGLYVDDAEARLLAQRRVAVVLCPRANARLRMGTAALEQYASHGVSLALGTGSAAVIPGLDVLAEAAAWARLARSQGLALWPGRVGPVEVDEQAVRLVTVDGAQAMGWGEVAGVLAPGRRADLAGVSVATTVGNVYQDLIEQGPGRQVLTVLGGVRRARRADAGQPWPELEQAS